MKKFTILIAALLIVAMGFAQFSRQERAAKPASRQMLTAVASDNHAGAINLKKSRAVTGTLQHCGEMGQNAIGANAAAIFPVGVRFEASELTSYVGQYITKVNVGIANASVITSARVAILTPATDSTYQIETEQACTFENGMNEVVLGAPFQIPAGEAILVAYEVVVTGGYPLGVDDGPVVAGANLVADELTGPYDPLNELVSSLTYNWIISATVEDNPFAVSPSAMSFVGFVGEAAPQAQQASVLAINVTGGINITTAAPFEVSADNTTFATTATLAEGGNFYVRYTPAATETLNVTGAVTITAEGRDTLTIALRASTYDCVTPISSFPYVEGFENGIPPCWTLIDADNDGHNWMNATELFGENAANYANNGTNCAISESYVNATEEELNANNWMITKAIALPTTGTLTASWYARSLDASYPDTYSVYIGTEPTVAGMVDTILSHTASGTWTEKTIDLTDYLGQTIYIGFNHKDFNEFVLLIDDFSVTRTISKDITITNVTFGTPSNCTLESNTVIVTVKNVGTDTIPSFELSYAVDTLAPVTVTINDTILPDSTYVYTFEEAIVVNEIGAYNVVVTATVEGDDNLEGNEKQASFEKMVPEIELTAILPYDEQEIRYGEPINIQGLVTNNSCELTSYIVTYKINDGDFVANDTITNITIGEDSTHIFTHSIPFEPEQPADTSEYTITVKVSMPNETADEAEDNEMTATFKVINCTTIGVPYLQNFENGLGVCWDAISNNIENQSTGQYPMGIYYQTETNKAWTFSSFTEAANGDYSQYLITPEIALTEDAVLSFDYAAIMASRPETFKVMISYTDNAVESFTDISDLITASSEEFENYMVVIPDTTKYIAIHYIAATHNTLLFIDNIELSEVNNTPEIALTSVAPATGSTMNSAFNISGVVRNLSNAPLTSYKVSYTIDGGEAVVDSISEINIALGATHEFTHSATISGLENGEHTIVVTVSEPNGVEDGDASDNSMTITINTITCNPITTFPYVEDFENGVDGCWTFIDADGDGNNWMHSSERFGEDWTGHSGTGAIVSESYRSSALTPDNWAITPALSLPENATIELSFYAAGQDASWAGEHYGVYVSTTTTEPSAFTLLWEETMNADGGQHREQGAWGAKHTDLSNYAGQTIYIGFRHFNCSDMFVFLLDDVTVSTTTSAEENIAEAIAVYPNPTNSMVTIANAEGRDIVVINSLGQVVASIENAAANQTIDVSNLANGTYFVKVDAEVVKLNVVK